MTHLDATAAAALTAAVLITFFYLRQRALERSIERARNRTAVLRVELEEARLSRVELSRTWAGHVDGAISHTLPEHERWWPVDRAGYLPIFEGDNEALAEYRTTAAAIRRAGAR